MTIQNKGSRVPAIDPITRSVIQHRLSYIVIEMGEAMLRTSYSQILNSSRDFSIAITDTDGRLVAQADHIPVHVGALPWATKAVEARFKNVKPGDVILLNDPYHGGSHLPDLTAFVPVFDGEERLFWTVVRAHQSDIGGATHGAYNPNATEIWQEGLRVPPLKLYEAGRLRDDLLDMLALNTRNGRDFRGDLDAMIGAAHLGERRMAKLFGEFGSATSGRFDTVLGEVGFDKKAISQRPAMSCIPGRTATSITPNRVQTPRLLRLATAHDSRIRLTTPRAADRKRRPAPGCVAASC